ncbi:HTH-type transcriptional regulator CdhR [Mycobacterium attenuatum]|uniref:helix-turn-helix transcriptional regulator n=1 Tax=Mycobacterium attenuatum TaxID=2341086 RepID=UPI000F0206C1|nr:helix-turn-helix transcriptional regulator [Mycobacterium attenuatum]VBA45663.1 HTH-type transcriptional regulator CdhR [Mycobacterium attenuatum]
MSAPTVVIDTDNLDKTEAFLSRTYATMRVGARPDPPTRLYVRRGVLGPVSLDEVRLSYDIGWTAAPLGKVRLSRVLSGTVHQCLPDGSMDSYGPYDAMIMGLPDRPFTGRCVHSHFDLVLVEPLLLQRVAATEPSRYPTPVRLTGHRPVSAAACRRINHTIEYLWALACDESSVAESPLVVATAADHLAATLLSAFPNTALADPTIEDRRDSTPTLLRRAVAYVDENAHSDICLTAIAEAIYVTPRALQYMFRKHMDCTPMEYVRRVRLHGAHQQLLTSTRTETTVAEIARRWGFDHASRFAVYYRAAYGRSPHQTLRS